VVRFRVRVARKIAAPTTAASTSSAATMTSSEGPGAGAAVGVAAFVAEAPLVAAFVDDAALVEAAALVGVVALVAEVALVAALVGAIAFAAVTFVGVAGLAGGAGVAGAAVGGLGAARGAGVRGVVAARGFRHSSTSRRSMRGSGRAERPGARLCAMIGSMQSTSMPRPEFAAPCRNPAARQADRMRPQASCADAGTLAQIVKTEMLTKAAAATPKSLLNRMDQPPKTSAQRISRRAGRWPAYP
jgi:hypothetical protein